MKVTRLLPALFVLAATLLWAQPAQAILCYPDADGDTYGDSGHPGDDQPDCPPGWVDNNMDCDDGDASVNPAASEICNGLDDNCDTVVDENAIDATTWYIDSDLDGYGDLAPTLVQCDQPPGYADNNLDCDDTDAQINPAADEFCNGVDDNCDTVTDENPVDGSTWYRDADLDGYGDINDATVQCSQPPGFVTNDADCDDTDAGINPDADEVCNGFDDDCDGTADDNPIDGTTWYEDFDGDGYGNPTSFVNECSSPPGYVASDTDCDDTDSSVNPGATEICNSIDDDCNFLIDDNVVDTALWYADNDGDGFGDAGISVKSCTPLPGFVDNDQDCDDTDIGINPDADELCNGLDDDCNGQVDDNPTDGDVYYTDSDGDGFGDPGSSLQLCAPQPGFTLNNQDCDDTDSSVSPTGVEVCNGIDDDCDGTVDNNASGAFSWWEDTDGDGYGDAGSFVLACTVPPGYVDNDLDCDDTDININPDASETCNNLDDDCDGTVDNDPVDGDTYWTDSDGDGYGDAGSMVMLCLPMAGFVDNDLDCDDTDAAISPDGTEICDSLDNNCDGFVDEGGVCIIIECPFLSSGDVDLSGNITSADIIYLVNFVFKGGAAPQPCDGNGDVECSGAVTSADIIYLVNFVFKGGPGPCDICTLWPDTWPCN